MAADNELNIGIAYSGRDELLQASKRLAADIASGKVEASSVSAPTHRSIKGYAYSTIDPRQLAKEKSVQVFITDGIGKGTTGDNQNQVIYSDTQLFFRPIDGNWYLFLMYTFY